MTYCGDLEFSIENGVVIGKEAKVQAVGGDFLLGHITKLSQIAADLNALPAAAKA